MEKLAMCRICLVQNVRMYLVVNRNFHELYEKLTDIPFVTEDRRPILACFFCFAKLKQCYRFLRKCVEAEELFAQIMNEDYEPKPLINQDHLEHLGGFIISPIENISIVDECLTDSIAIKEEELTAVCEGPDDIIESKEEHQSDASTAVAKKPKLEDAITAEHSKNEKSVSKVIRTIQKRTSNSKPSTNSKEPYKCDQRSLNRVKKNTEHTRTQICEKTYMCDVCLRSFRRNDDLTKHIRIHTGEKPYKCDVCQRCFIQKTHLTEHFRKHTGEKPYKCEVCQRSFSQKNALIKHIRIHTAEKPYKCNVCQQSFSQKSNLTRHIRVHW